MCGPIAAECMARDLYGSVCFGNAMAIDPSSQRRFVGRLLEFIGCRDETVAEAGRAIALFESGHSRHLGAA